ncbi:hypothetical protein pb186bvf_018779 [Paramecium bursaria]
MRLIKIISLFSFQKQSFEINQIIIREDKTRIRLHQQVKKGRSSHLILTYKQRNLEYDVANYLNCQFKQVYRLQKQLSDGIIRWNKLLIENYPIIYFLEYVQDYQQIFIIKLYCLYINENQAHLIYLYQKVIKQNSNLHFKLLNNIFINYQL